MDMHQYLVIVYGLGIMAAGMVAYIWLFWAAYVCVMGLYRAQLAGRLTGINRTFAGPALIIGLLLDLFANWTIAILWFTDWRRDWAMPSDWAWPAEKLVTARLKRYIASEQAGSLRYRRAKWICDSILDPFDPSGNHC